MIKITDQLIKFLEIQLNCKIIHYKNLGKGEHNVNILLQTNNGNYVLRTYANTQFDNADDENEVLKRLNGKFAPKVFYYDDSKKHIPYKYMIQEFIKGNTLEQFSSDDLIKLANILKEVHSITNPKEEREWKEPIDTWSKNNILVNSKHLGEEFHNEMKQLYFKVMELLESVKPLLEKYKRIHLIHNDIIPANVIKKNNGDLVLVDWELAKYDYFFFEFGCLIEENNLPKEKEALFLKEYDFGEGTTDKKILHAVKTNRILSLISWLIERISSIQQGKSIFVGEDNSKYEKQLKEELKHIDKLLSINID